MNVSGASVELLVRHFDLQSSRDLLIAVDDVAIPFGTLRLRGKGSSGGHNGLRSIEAVLQTPHYARLRIGIGPEAETSERELERFVLERFNQKEQKTLPQFFKKGEEACQLWATKTLEQAMNAVNPSVQ